MPEGVHIQCASDGPRHAVWLGTGAAPFLYDQLYSAAGPGRVMRRLRHEEAACTWSLGARGRWAPGAPAGAGAAKASRQSLTYWMIASMPRTGLVMAESVLAPSMVHSASTCQISK